MTAFEKFEGVMVTDISVFLGFVICNIHGHYFIWQVIALLHLDHLMWWQAAQLSPLFWFALWCIAVNIRYLLTLLK